jgi:hypothetical protein
MRALGTGAEVVHFPGWKLCYISVHNGTDANLHGVHHPIGVETAAAIQPLKLTINPTRERIVTKELRKKRDEAKEAWENATIVMKKAEKPDDFTGSKKAHDEAEKLRVEYLMAERASEADSEDENRLVMSAHR